MPESKALTELLHRWAEGDRGALNELVPVVYEELRRLARVQLANERAGHTLQPTALVHEVFLRPESYERISWQDRAHFFAVAARIMRRVPRRPCEKAASGETRRPHDSGHALRGPRSGQTLGRGPHRPR